jgi:lipid A ethanolaminephosphotransferase
MSIFKEIKLSSLILITSFFLVATGNFKFFQEVINVYPLAENFLFVVSLSVWIFALLVVILFLVCYRYSVKPILITILIISSVVSYFSNNYGVIVDVNMVTNTLETNVKESTELFSIKLLLYFLILGVLPSYWVYKTKITRTTIAHQLWVRIKSIVCFFLLFLAVTFIFFKSYSSFIREYKQLRYYVNPTAYIYSIGNYISSKIESANVEFKIIGKDAIVQRNTEDKKLVILVVGETARADKFSLNGYSNNTNPMLEKQNVISFSKMYSCGTDTAFSLPCMFSKLGKSDYSHKYGKNMSNALDILNYAGVEVLWLENNSNSKYIAERITYKDYTSADVNPVCDIECRDEGMLVNLQQYVDERKGKDIVIVLHTLGSHGPAYYKRYPSRFEKFTPVCKNNKLNECSDKEINNAYDNTILYADYVLSKTIDFLKTNSKEYKTAMFYMSDHGESLGENGIYLHGMPYFIAPEEQINVASVLWLSDNFDNNIDNDLLNKKAKTKLSHDGFFHTILGLMDVKTNVYDKDKDFIPYKK